MVLYIYVFRGLTLCPSKHNGLILKTLTLQIRVDLLELEVEVEEPTNHKLENQTL